MIDQMKLAIVTMVVVNQQGLDYALDALLGALRYFWRLNRFLRLNELSEAEYQWLRHGRRRNDTVTSKRMLR